LRSYFVFTLFGKGWFAFATVYVHCLSTIYLLRTKMWRTYNSVLVSEVFYQCCFLAKEMELPEMLDALGPLFS